MTRTAWLLPLSLLFSTAILCDPPDPDADLTWYTTCGDPVCQGYDGPFSGVPLCGSETEGDACSADGDTCDPVDGCNARLICAEEDPKAGPGGCPISRARYKKDVVYLDDDAVKAAAAALLEHRLATWRYTWEDASDPTHLGFIIDDVPGSPAVRADGDHVDLYGYTSLTVATLQAQQAEIAALRAELAELKARVDAKTP